MQPITTTGTPIVTVPWGRKSDLSRAETERVYADCQRGNMSHCINSNLVRAFAKKQGRIIRYPHTFKGDFHWSERIDEEWCQFIAPLSEPYARTIDGFDFEAAHFRAPSKCPMGPVRFVGFCKPTRPTTKTERKTFRSRFNARVEDGKLVPGARFREPQLPYVVAQNGSNAMAT